MDFMQVSAAGWVKNIRLISPDVVDSPAEKARRLNEDGRSVYNTFANFSSIGN
jgi:hypothetical protein